MHSLSHYTAFNCGPIPYPNATNDCSDTTYGTVCNIGCTPGYFNNGTLSVSCDVTGWLPLCDAASSLCPIPKCQGEHVNWCLIDLNISMYLNRCRYRRDGSFA